MAGGSKPAHNQSAGGWPPQGQPPQHEHEQQQQPAGYGQPTGGYNAAPPAYGSQPGGVNPYGAPPTGYGAPGSAPGGYGAPAGYGVQSSMLGGYGAPPTYGTPGAYGAPPPQGGYGGGYGYGQPQQAYPASSDADYTPGTDSEAIGIFLQADVDLKGSIDAHELGRALMSTGNVAFSPRTLRLMLHLFSDNKADPSKIGPVGFVKLWKEVQQWNKKFHEFDRDNSGSIEVAELSAALMSFNFNIPPAVLQILVAKYDVTGGNKSIGYDNFVECGFIVKGLTEKFKDQDRDLSGNATFDYTSFMLMVIPFVTA